MERTIAAWRESVTTLKDRFDAWHAPVRRDIVSTSALATAIQSYVLEDENPTMLATASVGKQAQRMRQQRKGLTSA